MIYPGLTEKLKPVNGCKDQQQQHMTGIQVVRYILV